MKKRLLKFGALCGGLLVITWFVFSFILLNMLVPTSSMEPTLSVDGKFIGNRTAYWFSDPERYDMVVFYHGDDDKAYVKRVIGLPGDLIEIKEGVVYANGEELDSSFIKGDMLVEKDDFWQVPDDSYFLLGDNRNNSEDSRKWKSAYIKKSDIIAKVWFQYSPEYKSVK